MHAFSIVAFLLIPILYALIQRLLLHPLRVLNQAQKRLRNGDLDCRITEKANSIEYEHSFQSFNKMADRIQDLKIEVYEKELDRKQMELSNLQLQDPPPFSPEYIQSDLHAGSEGTGKRCAAGDPLPFLTISAISSGAAGIWKFSRRNSI